jgi:hypothetical protein
MTTGFSVTFERWSHDDIDIGDTDDRGFIIENVSLRDAMQLGLEYNEPSCSGFCEPSDSRVQNARWLSFHEWNHYTRENLETGITENRSLHFPQSLTESSRRRICRLFGIKSGERF